MIEDFIGGDGNGSAKLEIRYVSLDLKTVRNLEFSGIQLQILLESGEGHACNDGTVSVVDKTAAGHFHVGEYVVIKKQSREHGKGDENFFFLAVNFHELVLRVLICVTNGHVAALSL